MKRNFKINLLIIINIFLIAGCDCISISRVQVPIPMSLFFEKSGIVATKVDNTTYNSVIKNDSYEATIDKLGRGFTINNKLLLADEDYCKYRVIKELWINGACIFTDNISNESSYSEYTFAGVNVSDVPLPKAKQECTTVSGFGAGTVEDTFKKGFGDFKVDSTNKNIWYIYYDDSWWQWDVSSLNLTWDGYERWQKDKRDNLNISAGISETSNGIGYKF